jgi:hypothetical protein
LKIIPSNYHKIFLTNIETDYNLQKFIEKFS